MTMHFLPFLNFTVAFLDCGINNNNTKKNQTQQNNHQSNEQTIKAGRSKIIRSNKITVN